MRFKVTIGHKKMIIGIFLVSIVMGIIDFLLHKDIVNMIRFMMLSYIMINLCKSDIHEYKVSNKYIIIGIIVGLITNFTDMCINKTLTVDNIVKSTTYMLITFIVLLAIKVIVKDNIGMGDLKLIFMLSFFYKIDDLINIMFMALLIAGLFSVISILLKKKNKKDIIPFVPFVFFSIVFYSL